MEFNWKRRSNVNVDLRSIIQKPSEEEEIGLVVVLREAGVSMKGSVLAKDIHYSGFESVSDTNNGGVKRIYPTDRKGKI